MYWLYLSSVTERKLTVVKTNRVLIPPQDLRQVVMLAMVEQRVITNTIFVMLVTLILLSSSLTVVHYLGLQEYLVVFLSLPLEYYFGMTAALLVGRVILALYRLIPVYRNFVRSVERITNNSSAIVSRINSMSNRPGNGSQKRGYSTSSRKTKASNTSGSTKSNGLNKAKLAISTPLDVLSLMRSKYLVIDKMIPLTHKLGTTLFKPFAFNNMLAHGRIGRLAGGIRRTTSFVNFVLKHWNNHGTAFTIKWIKCCHVAIAKCLGRNSLLSLRTLEEDLPLPRLLNGLPAIIPYEDRRRIRKGHVPTIRFWLGLFNLYRVLQAPGKLKLETITAPFTGSGKALLGYLHKAKKYNYFEVLPGWEYPTAAMLSPTTFVQSQKASPSNSTSMYGILTDVHFLQKYNPKLWSTLNRYIDLLGGWYFKDLLQRIEALNSVFKEEFGYKDPNNSANPYHLSNSGRPFVQPSHYMVKSALRVHGIPAGSGLSQFAIKEEAAGKVRVFALVDNITQSTLRPLHDYLFSILRKIPNDGTFNQEASVARCQEKAMKNSCAYSYDLTAATDRLPVILSQVILGSIIRSQLVARLWKIIMTSRAFGFLEPTAKKFKLNPEEEYRYAVGQPMGALSSWAMLAITHHWIVQDAARTVYPDKTEWFEGYEVLGDDIVIFDPLVAARYLEIMSDIGCGINLTKSIVSKSRPVFEFAKRIC